MYLTIKPVSCNPIYLTRNKAANFNRQQMSFKQGEDSFDEQERSFMDDCLKPRPKGIKPSTALNQIMGDPAQEGILHLMLTKEIMNLNPGYSHEEIFGPPNFKMTIQQVTMNHDARNVGKTDKDEVVNAIVQERDKTVRYEFKEGQETIKIGDFDAMPLKLKIFLEIREQVLKKFLGESEDNAEHVIDNAVDSMFMQLGEDLADKVKDFMRQTIESAKKSAENKEFKND